MPKNFKKGFTLINRVCQGFTLIELLVVIALIGILMAISLAAFSQTKKSARDTKRKADLEQVRSSLEIYRTDCRTYPATGSLPFGTGGLVGPSSIPACAGEEYMSLVPQDPASPTFGYYYKFSDANHYVLCAHLETGENAASADCGNNCRGGVCNYNVYNP